MYLCIRQWWKHEFTVYNFTVRIYKNGKRKYLKMTAGDLLHGGKNG